MKENAPKKTWFQTLRTLWVPLAIGVVTVAALAVVVGMVWKDYRTAMMDSQTRQMELVVQSTADSIRVLLEEYADRLDSIAGKAEAGKAFRPHSQGKYRHRLSAVLPGRPSDPCFFCDQRPDRLDQGRTPFVGSI